MDLGRTAVNLVAGAVHYPHRLFWPRSLLSTFVWAVYSCAIGAVAGAVAYTTLMRLNVVVNAVRRRMGLPYWSLSKMAKHKVKNAVSFISRFEEVVAHEAGARGVDGVVCGHIHNAEMREIEGIEYYNDGDWVVGCTALVEHASGAMEVLHWADEIAKPRNADPKRLLRYGFKVYSQNDEDGIIQEIFRRIGTTSKTFIEFGVESGRSATPPSC